MKNRIRLLRVVIMALIFSSTVFSYAADKQGREEKREEELGQLQKRFEEAQKEVVAEMKKKS